jgi:tetratricopeptide (TPR) repeat protein
MRWLGAGSLVLLAGVCLAADSPVLPALSLCSDAAGAPACQAPRKDLKSARRAFSRGLKREHAGNLEQAFAEFEEAARLVPQNLDYLTARELARQQLVGLHLQRGNNNLESGRQVEALAEFRMALDLDSQNEFAQQRIRDAVGPLPVLRSGAPQMTARVDAVEAAPQAGPRDFHYRGDARGLFTAIASSYGLTVIFDDAFPTRRLHFDMENVDFKTAMQAAFGVTKAFVVPLEATVLYAAADTQENHRLYDRMGMRSFYIPGASTPQELNDLLNTLRTLFELRFVSLNAASNTVTVRGPQGTLEAVTQFFETLEPTRDEVMLDVKDYEVDHTFTRSLGLHVPNTFKLFNIPVGALAALGGQNIQDLINQLISGGGINQAGNQSISALLAQLQSQQNSIFSQPLATFGGGLTFTGVSFDQLRATLSLNESSIQTLEHMTLRASQDKDATFKLGSRFPILNASFAPIFNSQAISQVIGNNSFTAPFPSVNYEDIGFTLKAKPSVHGTSEVSLQVEIQFRSLGTVSLNGVPVISNREFKGSIALKEGEPAVVAGMVSRTEQKSLTGLPAFSRVPLLHALSAENTREEDENELLIVITPYIVHNPDRQSPEIWLGK